MKKIAIRDIKVLLTAPGGTDLVVVKVETDEPGLHGWGCATFTQRYETVSSAITEYLRPLLIGRCVQDIEEIWQLSMNSAYWRNGPVLNNAISGVDEALWDIKGKLAGMPVYELLGGKVRPAAAVYRYADGATLNELEEDVRRHMAAGYRYLRVQTGEHSPLAKTKSLVQPEGVPNGSYYDPKQYMEDVIERFRYLREVFGYGLELIHDVHEKLSPIDAVYLSKTLEAYRPFYLEDVLPPEQSEWLDLIRAQSSVPMAMGELFVSPKDWKDLIVSHRIDYIRCHLSMIGGLTPARKLAALCECFGIRTAWHGPYDLTPVGMAAQLHLDVTTPNFGIQEFYGFDSEVKQVFPGCPEMKGGFLYPSDKPGFGVEVDEKAAVEYPCRYRSPAWVESRLPDGTAVRP